jgi:hypothetical protein
MLTLTLPKAGINGNDLVPQNEENLRVARFLRRIPFDEWYGCDTATKGYSASAGSRFGFGPGFLGWATNAASES